MGLGLREASAIALPAFIASRVAARPPALLMAQHAEQAGLLDLSRFRWYYDARTDAAVDRWLADLPSDLHDTARDMLHEAAEAAAKWWTAVASNGEGPPAEGDQPDHDDEQLTVYLAQEEGW